MSSWLLKWATAIGFAFIITPTSPSSAASVELSLSHEKESFLNHTQPLHSEVKDSTTSATLSGVQRFKSFFAKIGSGLQFIRKNADKAFILGLAILPSANTFSVTNLNTTGSYTVNKRGASCALPNTVILNASSSDYFNMIIRQVDPTAGNLTVVGSDPDISLYSPGIWNVTGNVSIVNFQTLHLLFFNSLSAQTQIFFEAQVTEVATGKTVSGQLSLLPSTLATSNFPQYKNFTRNGGLKKLDQIIITNPATICSNLVMPWALKVDWRGILVHSCIHILLFKPILLPSI